MSNDSHYISEGLLRFFQVQIEDEPDANLELALDSFMQTPFSRVVREMLMHELRQLIGAYGESMPLKSLLEIEPRKHMKHLLYFDILQLTDDEFIEVIMKVACEKRKTHGGIKVLERLVNKHLSYVIRDPGQLRKASNEESSNFGFRVSDPPKGQ